MRIALTKKQIFAGKKSTARVNVWHGSVRSGKTYGLFHKFNHYVNNGPDGKLAIVAKTLETLNENILEPMNMLLGKSMKSSDAGRKIYISGRRIRGVGANDEKSVSKIQGDTLAGAMGDEGALWPESFFKMLLSRLSVAGSQLFLSTNPESPYLWLKKDFIDRGENGEINLNSFHFHIDENTTLDPDYVSDLKKEYTGVWYKRYIDGLWVVADGIIYDMFSRERHVVNAQSSYPEYIVGIDYGTSNPFVAGLFGIDGDKAVMCKELYYDSRKVTVQKTDSQYADMLADFLHDTPVKFIYVDPSAASFITTLKQDDRFGKVIPATNAVLPGIRFVSERLNKGLLFVDESCMETLKEFETYSWDKRAQQRGEDKPLKENDHCSDALRYAIFSYFKKSKVLIA